MQTSAQVGIQQSAPDNSPFQGSSQQKNQTTRLSEISNFLDQLFKLKLKISQKQAEDLKGEKNYQKKISANFEWNFVCACNLNLKTFHGCYLYLKNKGANKLLSNKIQGCILNWFDNIIAIVKKYFLMLGQLMDTIYANK